MAALTNPRHELFAQQLVKGKPNKEAYHLAGYIGHRSDAAAMARRPLVKARVAELLAARNRKEHQALERATERLAVTKERVLAELVKIGFADIRKAVGWRVSKKVDEETGEETTSNEVWLVDSDKVDDHTAAAIAEIKQNAQGGVSIKFHDKRAALVDLGRHLGMFRDKVDVTHEVVGITSEMSAEEAMRVFEAVLRGGVLPPATIEGTVVEEKG
jgi:phage terminase small subunit